MAINYFYNLQRNHFNSKVKIKIVKLTFILILHTRNILQQCTQNISLGNVYLKLQIYFHFTLITKLLSETYLDTVPMNSLLICDSDEDSICKSKTEKNKLIAGVLNVYIMIRVSVSVFNWDYMYSFLQPLCPYCDLCDSFIWLDSFFKFNFFAYENYSYILECPWRNSARQLYPLPHSWVMLLTIVSSYLNIRLGALSSRKTDNLKLFLISFFIKGITNLPLHWLINQLVELDSPFDIPTWFLKLTLCFIVSWISKLSKITQSSAQHSTLASTTFLMF